ncbi:GNAT family N-acetyltransferase [Sphingomonas koreensis]
MTPRFRRYAPEDAETCLALFDANCPRFFAPGERADYAAYLDGAAGYRVCEADGEIRGAFGVAPGLPGRAHLNWILIDPAAQRLGIGRAMMQVALDDARSLGAAKLDIAASQHSAPFFARFGARELSRAENGWGPGMHRIDMVLEISPAG